MRFLGINVHTFGALPRFLLCSVLSDGTLKKATPLLLPKAEQRKIA